MPERTPFEELVLPHLNAAYNLARWLARNPQDAQDVVQDACLRALKHLHGLRGADARPWFLTIVRHAFYDWRKRNAPADAPADDALDPDSIADPAALDPEQVLQRSTEARLLAQAVGALPLALREVLILREFEDLSYKQIAAVAGVPLGTVMSRLSRARALLQSSAPLRAARDGSSEVHHGMQ